MKKNFQYTLLTLIAIFFFPKTAISQTDIQIVAPDKGHQIAVPVFCNADRGEPYTKDLPELIQQNLRLTGIFSIIESKAFVEQSGKCIPRGSENYSDWRLIKADLLVRGRVTKTGVDTPLLIVDLFLYDVVREIPLIGKQYTAQIKDFDSIAHKFSNAIMRHFTGESGTFGSKIAFVGKVGKAKELFISDLNGANKEQLTNDKSTVLSPAWSADGKELVFTSYRNKRPELYRYNIKRKLIKQVTDRPGVEIGPQFTKDGKQIITGARISGFLELVKLTRRGRFLSKLTSSKSSDISPSLSPDGRKIAFVSNRADGNPQIYVMSADGGHAQKISNTSSDYCTSPAWAPNGQYIAFVCDVNGQQLFLTSPQGANTVQLTFQGNNESPSWSPDGRALVYSSDFGQKGVKNLALFTLHNLESWQISFSDSDISQPAWSPVTWLGE